MELTKTEFKVCAYKASGYETKIIADILCRSYYTVVDHFKNIRTKNNLNNECDIVREFTLKFGDPRKFIAIMLLAMQVGIMYQETKRSRKVAKRTSKVSRQGRTKTKVKLIYG